MITWQRGMTLAALEKLVILQAFRECRGNKTESAKILDIAIRTLEVKLAQYAEEDNVELKRRLDAELKGKELQDRARGIHAKVATLHPPGPGLFDEPAAEVSTKQAVPVSVRKEVQGMPQKQDSAVHNRKAR